MRTSAIIDASFLALAVLVAAPISASADIVIGLPALTDTGNCYPFGCFVGQWLEYQQVYAASDFSGTITITDLEFYNTELLDGASPDTGCPLRRLASTR